MRATRIYTSLALHVGEKCPLDDAARHHAAQVLRLRAGAELVLFNGDGYEYRARLVACNRRLAQVEVLTRATGEPAGRLRIALGLAISKGERMDFAIQKSVELGVDAITPLVTERSVVRLPPERMEKRRQHWQRVLISACEQSGRCRLPLLLTTAPLTAWLPDENDADLALLLDHRAAATLDSVPPPLKGRVRLLVGPEGGLSSDELSAAQTLGFVGVRLGPRVLRTETAPLAAIAAMQALWGDFRSG